MELTDFADVAKRYSDTMDNNILFHFARGLKDLIPRSIPFHLERAAFALLVPNVTSADDVRRVIRYAKFAPLGMRGACPGVRANGYGTGGHEPYYIKANEYVAVLAQIETLEACNEIDEILDIEGLDGIWLAPVDLSMHMGYGGNAGHPGRKG